MKDYEQCRVRYGVDGKIMEFKISVKIFIAV